MLKASCTFPLERNTKGTQPVLIAEEYFNHLIKKIQRKCTVGTGKTTLQSQKK